MWLFLSIIASFLQTLRNSFQRGLLGECGTWAATWVRFAFGFPVSFAVFVVIAIHNGGFAIAKPMQFVTLSLIGALAQVLATAALLKSMDKASFALGATLQHTSLLITAMFGWLFLGDLLSKYVWLGIFLATFGMAIATWPRGEIEKENLGKTIEGGLWGLVCGACFAVSANAFRMAVLSVSTSPNFLASSLTVSFVQLAQTIGVFIYLWVFERQNLKLALKYWKQSLGAGVAGASSSVMWFLALALVPAALARAVNLAIEAPTAIIIGAMKFKEGFNLKRIIAIALIVAGVIIAVMGH